MPVVSQAQRRLMYAERAHPGTTDVPTGVAEDFINASHGIKGLPNRVAGKQKLKEKVGKPHHRLHPLTRHLLADALEKTRKR